jgi:uncharacterized Zn finger protein (UPF0148 family)
MKHCKNCGSILFKIGDNNQPICANCGSNGECEGHGNKDTSTKKVKLKGQE